MKLIQKTSRYYLIYTFLVLSLGSSLFYFLIKIVLIDSIDEGLRQERDQIVSNLKYEMDIDELKPSENVIIHRISSLKDVDDNYKVAQVYVPELKEHIDFRQLKSVFSFKGGYYEIIIRHSLQEAESLLQGLFPMVIILFLVVLLGVFLINQYLIKKLWEPFYELLYLLKNYELNKSKVIVYKHSDIQEFNELNLSLEKMTARIYNDFLSQKEFNENSSHELQTPIAVIKNKLDLLIQSPGLKENDLETIDAIYGALRKLSNLNKGLNLLSKIDNRQFLQKDEIDIKLLTGKLIREFSEQIEEKGIKVYLEITPGTVIKSNQILIEILLTNLISNAVKHNVYGGEITVRAGLTEFSIENKGKALSVPADEMFGRFKKDSEHGQSIGLGLAIVKKICDSFNYTVSYEHENEIHNLSIIF